MAALDAFSRGGGKEAEAEGAAISYCHDRTACIPHSSHKRGVFSLCGRKVPIGCTKFNSYYVGWPFCMAVVEEG